MMATSQVRSSELSPRGEIFNKCRVRSAGNGLNRSASMNGPTIHRRQKYSEGGLCVNRKTDRKIAKVLVVEDHREFLQFLELALTRRGWEVITSASGREALDKLEHTTPSLILLDMWMPGMDGFELAQFLKTSPRYRDIPILAVTGLLS